MTHVALLIFMYQHRIFTHNAQLTNVAILYRDLQNFSTSLLSQTTTKSRLSNFSVSNKRRLINVNNCLYHSELLTIQLTKQLINLHHCSHHGKLTNSQLLTDYCIPKDPVLLCHSITEAFCILSPFTR